KRLFKEAAYPAFLGLFDAALYVGERNRAYYTHYRYPDARLFRSPHCIDTQRFAGAATPVVRNALRSRLNAGPDSKLVLFAGKLVAFKRPLDLVGAVALLRTQGLDAQVLVAGAGSLEGAMRDRAHDLGVPLHLLGFQNQTAMPQAYAAADALVL